MKNTTGLLSLTRVARVTFAAAVIVLSGCSSGGGGDPQSNIDPASNPAADTIGPLVSATSPANQSAAFAVNSSVSVTFSEAVDPQAVTAVSFQVDGPSGQVAGVVALQSNFCETPSGRTPTVRPFVVRKEMLDV